MASRNEARNVKGNLSDAEQAHQQGNPNETGKALRAAMQQAAGTNQESEDQFFSQFGQQQ